MAKFDEYPSKTTPAAKDTFLMHSQEDNAERQINYEKLADAILNKLTSKTFTLDQGVMTLLSALNQLNSINEKCFFVILAGATDTRCVAFIYGLKSNSDEVNYTDIINNKVSFSGSREDNTITINSGNWSRGMIYSYEPFTVETT